MLYRLNAGSKEPLYEQLEALIAKYACLGVLEAHEQLPSVRVMAGELGINPNTVAKAYKNLETKGIIYSVGGKGAFVSDNEAAKLYVLRQSKTEFKAAVLKAKNAGMTAESLTKMIEEIYKGGSADD